MLQRVLQRPVGKVLAAARFVSDEARIAHCRLDAVGARYGTWLSSIGRDCLRHWEPLLAPLRNEAFDLLEIGVGTGASLRTWREWFPRAQLVGFDARRLTLDPPIPGSAIVQGNQTDTSSFHPLLRTYQFRLIVADGSLHDDDQIRTFVSLFPWLEPDSLYLCAGFEGAGGGDGHEAASWFAELGLALVAPPIRQQLLRDHPDLEPVLRRLRGVYLGGGSVVAKSAALPIGSALAEP